MIVSKAAMKTWSISYETPKRFAIAKADITKSVSWNNAKTAPVENCYFLNLIKI